MDKSIKFPTTKRRTTSTDSNSNSSSSSSSQTTRTVDTKPTRNFFNPLSYKRFKSSNSDQIMTSSTKKEAPLLIRFYDPDIKAKDTHGRTLDAILAWNDSKLESCHNYIQMLFPLPEGSVFNFEAPIVDREIMDAFRARWFLRSRLLQSFERILAFYGFQLEYNYDGVTGAEGGDGNVEKNQDLAGENQDEAVMRDTTIEDKDDFVEIKPTTDKKTVTTSLLVPSRKVIRAPNFKTASKNWAVRMDHNHLRISRILRCLRVLGLEAECEQFYAALKNVFDEPGCRIGDRSFEFWTKAATNPLYIAPDGERSAWLKGWMDE
jgi:hypothetical protein